MVSTSFGMSTMNDTSTSATEDTTDDVFLGGKIVLRQPRTGYRAGMDAAVLAASVHADADARILDIGSGVGAVGLCAARRLPDVSVTLVERDPDLCQLARHNITHNGLDKRVGVVQADVAHAPARQFSNVLPDNSFTHVIANPPYYDQGAGTPASDSLRASSHAMPAGSIADWVKFMARMARPAGQFMLIQPPSGLPQLISALSGRFGSISIVPVFSRPEQQHAIRMLVHAVKGSRGPFSLLPSIYLHGEGQTFTPAIEAVVRECAELDIGLHRR